MLLVRSEGKATVLDPGQNILSGGLFLNDEPTVMIIEYYDHFEPE